MNTVLQFVLKHGYSILFAALFAHQIGLPLPGPLFLLAAGALIAAGKLGLVPALALAVTACVLADWVWYEAGRRGGDRVLHFIHRLTKDPDHHDRRAKETFARYGLLLLVVAKFVPGLDAVTPPLAGTSRTSRIRFFAFDAVGASLYSGVYAALGYIFSHDLDRAAAYAGRVGGVLAGVAVAALSIYLVRKLVLRHRFASDLRRGHAFMHAGIATVKRHIASALIRDWSLAAYFPLPWHMICTTCAAQGKELLAGETHNAAR
jgi:membrane protein DedA with SNARE-associated domain